MAAWRFLLLALVVGCASEKKTADRVLFENGVYGTWEFDDGSIATVEGFVTSGIGVGNVAVADDVTGGLPSLEMTSSQATGRMGFQLQLSPATGAESDLRPYASGHLAFDIKLVAGDATLVRINLFPSLNVDLPIATLSTSEFIHVEIPFTPDLYGTSGPQSAQNGADVFSLQIDAPTTGSSRPVAILNDIRWTAK